MATFLLAVKEDVKHQGLSLTRRRPCSSETRLVFTTQRLALSLKRIHHQFNTRTSAVSVSGVRLHKKTSGAAVLHNEYEYRRFLSKIQQRWACTRF